MSEAAVVALIKDAESKSTDRKIDWYGEKDGEQFGLQRKMASFNGNIPKGSLFRCEHQDFGRKLTTADCMKLLSKLQLQVLQKLLRSENIIDTVKDRTLEVLIFWRILVNFSTIGAKNTDRETTMELLHEIKVFIDRLALVERKTWGKTIDVFVLFYERKRQEKNGLLRHLDNLCFWVCQAQLYKIHSSFLSLVVEKKSIEAKTSATKRKTKVPIHRPLVEESSAFKFEEKADSWHDIVRCANNLAAFCYGGKKHKIHNLFKIPKLPKSRLLNVAVSQSEIIIDEVVIDHEEVIDNNEENEYAAKPDDMFDITVDDIEEAQSGNGRIADGDNEEMESEEHQVNDPGTVNGQHDMDESAYSSEDDKDEEYDYDNDVGDSDDSDSWR